MSLNDSEQSVVTTGLHEAVSAAVDAAIQAQTKTYPVLGDALRTLVREARREEQNAVALPFLVCAADGTDPELAVPVATAHSLWWQSANLVDDIADTGRVFFAGLPAGPALMAALELGHALPLRILTSSPVPERLRSRFAADYLDGWTGTNDGQVRDLLSQPATSDTRSSL